jgi:hypothetical protein
MLSTEAEDAMVVCVTYFVLLCRKNDMFVFVSVVSYIYSKCVLSALSLNTC